MTINLENETTWSLRNREQIPYIEFTKTVTVLTDKFRRCVIVGGCLRRRRKHIRGEGWGGEGLMAPGRLPAIGRMRGEGGVKLEIGAS